MKGLTLKEKILISLFEIGKTTGELLVSLEYKKNQYNAIDNDLKSLVAEGLIFPDKRKNTGSRGQPPTFYEFIYELPNLQKTYEKYSSLRSAMQKNDTILLMLVEKQFWVIDYKKLDNDDENIGKKKAMCNKCISHLQKPLPCGENEQFRELCLISTDSDLKLYGINIFSEEEIKSFEMQEESIANELKNEFKACLGMSPYFFRSCLNNTPEVLKQQLNSIYNLAVDAHLEKHPLNSFSIGNEPLGRGWSFFDKIFEICVVHDIMEKEASEEAVKKVSERNGYIARVLDDRERIDIITYYEIPDILKSRYERYYGKPFKTFKFRPHLEILEKMKERWHPARA